MLGVPELLVLLAAVLMGYGSSRIPQLIRAADEARRCFQPGARLPTDQPFEPAGLTLRQIQFRGSGPTAELPGLPELPDVPPEPAEPAESVAVDPAPVTFPLLTFSGARRVPVPSDPVDSAVVEGWEDIFV